MQTQTSNTLHNVIMKAGGKDRSPMLAPGNYVQWKSIIKRYIDTKPNHELIHHCLKNPPYKFTWADKEVPVSEGSPVTTTETYMETYTNVSQNISDQLNAEAEAVQIILTWINNDIYFTIDACPNACEMWKVIERLKQGESINVQDLETNLYWKFRKFTSQDGESLEWYYSRFYKMMNELIRNQYDSQELKTISHHKIYDILKQHQNEVNKIRAERIARVANPLALVAQQQPVYHPQNHHTHYNQNSSTRSQQATIRNIGKAIVNSPSPIYDQEPSMVVEDDEMSKDKEIDKLMALISLSFKKIYKTNNNLRTSSNTSRANQDNSLRINRSTGYENQRIGNVAGAWETVGSTLVQKSRIQCYNCKEFGHAARECQKPKKAKDAAYHREKMLLCKQEKAGIHLNAEQADWRDDTDDESKDQELEAHYIDCPIHHLEVAFRKSTCYIRDLKGNDLLIGSSGTDLYSITLQKITSPNPICLMAKATSSQAWLWHRRLSHLNFDTINLLSKNDIVIGLPKLKFVKDHLCSSCELGKAKRKSFQYKTSPSSKRRLQLLHIDLCGPMRVASINGKRYVLVIVDDYSRYTWTHLLRSKDETLEVLIDFLRLVQRGLHAQEKGDACIFVGYSTQSRAYRIFNKRTRVIVETIHVNFDELPQMASDHVSSDPDPQCQSMALEHANLSPDPQSQENVTQADKTVTTSNELELLFSLMFYELINGYSQVVSKSSAVSTDDAPNQRQQQHTTSLNNQTTTDPTCQVPSQAPTVVSTENINQAEMITENAQVENNEFINIFCTSVQDRGEISSRHVDSSNMHTFYQHYPSEHCWTKDHPSEQDHDVNPPHIDECCCECGNALDGIFCQQCTCKSCGKGTHIGYNFPPKVSIISNQEPCNQTMNNELPQTLPSFDTTCYSHKENSVPCVSKPNFVDESSNIFNPPPQPPIYSCEFCWSNAQYGHYCTPQVSFINPEPGYSQDFNFPQNIHDFQQQYLCCNQCDGPHETFQCQQVVFHEPCCENCGGPHENFQCQPINQNFYNPNSSGFDQTQPPQFPVIHPPPQEISIEILHDQENVINSVQTFLRKFNRYSFFETLKELAEYINTLGWNRHAFYDDDVDYTIAIIPVLSTQEPVDFLSIPDTMCDVHLVNNPTPLEAKDHFEIVINSNDDISSSDDDSLYKENVEYVEASPHDSEVVSLEVAEIVIPEEEEIEDDNLRENFLNVHLLTANIEALKDNPTPSSKLLTKSSSTSPKSFLEETNTFHNSLPEFENFYFDLEEISSGSTTTHSDIPLSDYEAFSFNNDHIKEISSGSTTTHSDISLSEYDSFTFDLSNDHCPPTDRSNFANEEFADKLAHIISPSKYDRFYF
nr:retrovirus-related Pol polyprotein from transposon TNT 1-94 [Tanacetum cinerariifolium]